MVPLTSTVSFRYRRCFTIEQIEQPGLQKKCLKEFIFQTFRSNNRQTQRSMIPSPLFDLN